MLNGVELLVWLTDVLERMVSGWTKTSEPERLLSWAWKAERLAAAVHGWMPKERTMPAGRAGRVHASDPSAPYPAGIGSACLGIGRKNRGFAGAGLFNAGLHIGL
jgi:hypothetical protein